MSGDLCPCGSKVRFDACCGPYLAGADVPETAEQLMRSRYSAYVQENIAYLKETLWPKHQPGFDAAATARWAAESHWTGLKVLETDKGVAGDREGTVLFEATYLSGGKLTTHRENSRFRKKAGRWYYVEALAE
jgi:SEC-C motif-containing protein